MEKQTQTPLRVGFDLDGVILYNPLRLARPIVHGVKSAFSNKKKTHFLIPRSPLSKFVFKLAHKLSLFKASGFDEIRQLTEAGIIEPYLITARYGFLKDDYENFLKKNDIRSYFKECYYNKDDEQPHLYKERLIRQHKLAFFVEDNWDIVDYLYETVPETKVLWMYNWFDSGIYYPYKFAHLDQAIAEIKKFATRAQS